MSSPTYPACVSEVQSQMANGTSKHFAIVCANNVFPKSQEYRIKYNKQQTKTMYREH